MMDQIPPQEIYQQMFVDKEVGSCIVTALPPEAQRAREIDAILKDPRLLEMLSGEEIALNVIKIHSGYVVLTDRDAIQVDVRYLPSEKGICGPARFELVFYPPERLR